jgi:hypothetical protein
LKSLRARVRGCIVSGSALGIAMQMSSALGQACPDPVGACPVPVPEPSILPLFGAGAIALLVVRRLKN